MKNTYMALVTPDLDEGGFTIEFPDLVGCISEADSEDDILPNAIEVLDLYFEGESFEIEPRSSAALSVDHREELEQGAYLLAVPLIARETANVRINVSMQRGMLDAIDDAAARLKLNRSAFLALAALREIKTVHSAARTPRIKAPTSQERDLIGQS